MAFIEIKDLLFKYKTYADEKNTKEKIAIDHLSLSIHKGDFVAILGANGSGKSTLAKQISALLFPTEGTVVIQGMNTREEKEILNIRKTAGMVFQNPDNQIVSNTVEEDVAFGPENLGFSREEMMLRIEKALEATGMTAYRYKDPNQLSGGQKQRIAISGILAMAPECIILDEPTAMLDPKGREDVLKAIEYLNKEKGITILYITHHVEEVINADYIYVMEAGKIKSEGKKEEVLQADILEEAGLQVPFLYTVKNLLSKHGYAICNNISTEGELIKQLCLLQEDGEKS